MSWDVLPERNTAPAGLHAAPAETMRIKVAASKFNMLTAAAHRIRVVVKGAPREEEFNETPFDLNEETAGSFLCTGTASIQAARITIGAL
jgi:hypothetical protein